MFELLFTHPLWAYRAGKFTFASGWPIWMLATLVVLAAAVVAGTLWRRRYLGAPRLLSIGLLQVALAALLLTMLWRPVLNVERVRDRQNVLAVLLDNSSSMMQVDAYGPANGGGRGSSTTAPGTEIAEGVSPTRLQQAIAALEAGPLAELSKTFELRYFSFGNAAGVGAVGGAVMPIEKVTALPASGTQTRIGDALLNVLQTAGSVPLAGVMLVSDGAENGRSLGEGNLADIASYGVPVHAVGVGPERVDNDLELGEIDLPTSIAPGATVTADVTIRHSGPADTRLRIYDRETLLAARELKLTGGASNPAAAFTTTVRVEFPAGEAGVRDLRLTLDALPNERNTVNNSRRRVVNVPATRRNILYVEGEPRWEFKFLRRAVEGERSLRLASIVRTTQNKFYRQGVTSAEELEDGLPTTAEELFKYDAIIIGSFEAAALSPAQHQMLKDFVDLRGGGLLMLSGNHGLSDGGWSASVVAQVLPVHVPKRGKEFVQTPLKAQLTRYGAESTIMRFDADPKRNAEQWQTLPDLANYQRLGALRPGAIVLLEGAIKNERVPLLVQQRYGSGSAFVLATASTQRWQMSLPVEDLRHEMFWRQLLHALADRTPQRAWLSSDRAAYEDERSVTIEAELRDEKFVPVADARNRPKVELLLTPESGEPIMHEMQPSPTSPGRFIATLDAPATGLYRADIAARFEKNLAGKPEVLSANTAFRRDDNVVEHFDTAQDRAVLERLARETQGRYWTLASLPDIASAIPYTKSGIVERQVLDLWNLPFVFLLLLALKLGEWLLRLRWGTL